MKKNFIPDSELIINPDGSVFHLHLTPEQLTDKIIVVGDPERVNLVASFFDKIEFEVSSREFHTIGGYYKGKRLMCLSHGIGSDNIDIVITELDALANVDFHSRTINDKLRSLEIVRIGTSGSLQADIPIGTPVMACKAIGFDGVLNFYAGRNAVCDIEYEKMFCAHTKWNELWCKPYVVDADNELVQRIGRSDMLHGNTVSAAGFYGPQGRNVRLAPAEPELNSRLSSFLYDGQRITNYEMESAALQGMAKLMGHKALTVCAIIANRNNNSAAPSYHSIIERLIVTVLDRI